jgi:tetratricopeptide (TPR) repeat protein
VRLAAGIPPRAVAQEFAASIARLEKLPRGTGDFLRAQAVAALYVSYLTTRDPRTLALLREWRGQPAMTELDALAALDANDTTAARAAMRYFPSADSVKTNRAPVAIPRWIARARAYEAVGDLRGAVAAYSVLEPHQISPAGQADPSWPFYARSLLWRGQLQERLGDRAAAIDSYQRFVTLWAEADSALQPQRELARASLRRLGVAS